MFRVAFLLLFVLTSSASAQEWTRFRGPNGAGVGSADVPDGWTEKDFHWKTALPGKGHSSPVLWGDRLFLTSGDRKSGERVVLCLDAKNGQILWQKSSAAAGYKMHARNSNATSTPAVDAERVYLSWATPKEHILLALDHDGKEVWNKVLGPFAGNHGFGVSPILHDGLIILPNEQDTGGSLVAFDAKTGAPKWNVPRKSGNATYSTPVVYQTSDRPAEIVFTNWKHGITAIDPRSGKVSWEISCFEPDKQERAIASPILVGDLVIGTCGFVTAQKHFVAVRPGTDGKAKEVWRYEKAVAHLPTPIVKDGYIYSITEKGIITCLDGKTGEALWQDRLPEENYASPVLVGNRIFQVAQTGDVYCVEANPKEFKLLASSSLGEPSQATPAVANGRMYFRTDSHVMAVGKK